MTIRTQEELISALRKVHPEPSTCREAASEIERLAAELAQTRALRAENERLRAKWEHEHKLWQHAVELANSFREERDNLRALDAAKAKEAK